MKVFDITKICIAKPLFPESRFFEFSCGKGAFVDGFDMDSVSLSSHCPFCEKPVNSLVEIETFQEAL